MTLREWAIDLVDHVAGDVEVWHARTLSPWQRQHLVLEIERKLGEVLRSGDLDDLIVQRLGTGQCFDPACPCHTDPAKNVITPFPLEWGPVYCCSRCARRPLSPTGRRT